MHDALRLHLNFATATDHPSRATKQRVHSLNIHEEVRGSLGKTSAIRLRNEDTKSDVVKIGNEVFGSVITGPRLILPELSGDSVTWECVGCGNQIAFVGRPLAEKNT